MGKLNKSKKQPRLIEDPKHIDDSDDSEIDEDEAFNSEDERLYGDFFKSSSKKKSTDSDEDETVSSSDASSLQDDSEDDMISDDDDKEGDGGQYMLSLLDKLSSGAPSVTEKEKEQARLVKLAGRTVKESEFSTHTSGRNETLTMDQLMNGISDTAGFRSLQEALGGKESSAVKTTNAPVAKVISERAMRKVLYRNASKDVKLWDQSTKEIREADTLDFRPTDKAKVTRADLVSKFEPSNDFEKEMADLLSRAGAKHENQIIEQESKILDDLGESGLTMEDIKKRQAALSKMRSLLFYEEQKRNKINKIKSKKYRKIRKKQNERAKGKALETAIEADPELAREMAEKEEIERMEERMTLSHKNTSKWAKQQLRRGANLDKESKQALSAQVKLGDDLRKRMNGIGDDDSDDDIGNHELSNEELLAKARSILDETNKDIDKASEKSKKGNGLHDMAFMKRGLEIQRERAKEEAKKLLQELEDDSMNDGEDDDSYDGKQTITQKITKKTPKATNARETAKVLPKGKLVASALELANSNSITTYDGISIEIGSDNQVATKQNRPHEAIIIKTDNAKVNNSERELKLVQEATNESTLNPWIQDKNKCASERIKNVSKHSVIDVKEAASIFIRPDQKKPVEVKKDLSNLAAAGNTAKTISLTQNELVRRAFAAPTDAEIEAEFEAEKVRHLIKFI